ncbi:MAG: thioredoxin fold domain-containing protein [Bacteroidota bacterium]
MNLKFNQIFLLVGLFCFSMHVSWGKTQADFPFFQGSLNQLKEQAKNSQTPYMIYFYLQDCESCTRMSKETFNYQPLQQYVDRNYLAFKVNALDLRNGIDIAESYNIKQYPSVLIIGPDEVIRDRIPGFISGAGLQAKLNQAHKATDQPVGSVALTNNFAPSVTTTPPATSRGVDATPGQKPVTPNYNLRTDYQQQNYNSNSIVSAPPATSSNNGTTMVNGKPVTTGNNPLVNSNKGNQTNTSSLPFTSLYRKGLKKGRAPQTGSESPTFVDNRNAAKYNNQVYPSYPDYRQPATTSNTRGSNPYGSRTNAPTYLDSYTKSRTQNSGTVVNGYSSGYSNYQDYLDQQKRQQNPPTTQPNNDRSTAPSLGYSAYRSYRDGAATTATTGNIDEGVLPCEIEVAYDNQGRAYRIKDLPDGTSLKKGDQGRWMIVAIPTNSAVNYSAYRTMGSTQAPVANNTRGMEPKTNARIGSQTVNYRTSADMRSASQVANKQIVTSIPGLDSHSPDRALPYTFAILIDTYNSLNDLKGGLRELQKRSNSQLWAYSVKVNGRHFYHLAMGTYHGEDEAVNAALGMGATWQELKVVNLSSLN